MAKLLQFSLLVFSIISTKAVAQDLPQRSLSNTRFVYGLSAPEFLHIGLNYDLSKTYQLGINGGVGPSWGTVWPQVSIEQRLYFSKVNELSERKTWFTRQGINYFPAGEHGTLTISLGKDLKSRHASKGWTIDMGVSSFIFWKNQKDKLFNNEPYHMHFPSLRFQRYFYKYKKQVPES